MSSFEETVCRKFNTYLVNHFSNRPEVFDRPVFLQNWADLNVIVNPKSTDSERQTLLDLLPKKKRHRWFGSMKSSQALAQSVFGNLIVHRKLDLLSPLKTDDGRHLFIADDNANTKCSLEYAIDGNPLNERALTEVDVFFHGEYQITVECKFAEVEVGACSIPVRRPQMCDGSLQPRKGATGRCYLAEKGIKYWEHIPEVFKWGYDTDSNPCPIRFPYQLVRNVLAACTREDGSLEPRQGHAVLVFDKRNPAFQPGGKGDRAWNDCKQALKYPHLLQRCSWQTIIGCLRKDPDMRWLVDAIGEKYGIF